MKSGRFYRLFCGWLAGMVLLGSTGFGTVEHWCQLRGHSKSVLLTEMGCSQACPARHRITSPKTDGPVFQKQACCKTRLAYHHLDVNGEITEPVVAAGAPVAAFLPNPSLQRLLNALLPVLAVASFFSSAHDPVARTGRFRLLLGCTWLI